MCEPRALLSVVIPIAESGSSWRSELIHEDAAAEDSECTEDEKVAVEQLTELRHMRGLSLLHQHDTHDYAGNSSTDASLHTCARKLPLLLPAPPCMTCDDPSTSSPATSTSAPACRVKFWNLKHTAQDRQQHKRLKQDHFQDACDEIGTQVSASSKPAITFLGCDHLEISDDGERLKPRSRLLSEIYGDDDHSEKLSSIWSSVQPNIKTSKRRRRAMSKIMTISQPHVSAALAGSKDHSTDASE